MPTAANRAVETLAAPPLGGAAAASTAAAADSARSRLLVAVLCSVLVAIPFLAVRFPPITDLPQHAAQIRLFLAALGDPEGAYRIQWFTPYSAAYALLGAAWALSTPANAGRLAVLALGVLWTLAVHVLAARLRRPTPAAVLASGLVFNVIVYWGFLSFATGWIAFIVWYLVTTRRASERPWWCDVLPQFGAALLLYCSHALWFAFGAAWLVVYAIVHRWPFRLVLRRVAAVSPVIVGAALWYPHLAALGFTSSTVWATPPLERVSAHWIVNAVLGGIYGPTEYLTAAILLAWISGGFWQQRKTLPAAIDVDLLGTGLLMAGLCFVLPDQYTNTIVFAERWLPPAAILILLAAPAPTMLAAVQRRMAIAVVAIFCLAITLTWMRFERDELSGLDAALAALPDGQRVLGLDLVQDSDMIKGRPFVQTFAYAQVLHGGRLNMSFAGHAPSLVVYRTRRTAPWTAGLEWYAERVRATDFAYFDYALINGRPNIHAQTSKFHLAPVTADGRWRLYRVTSPAP